MPLSDPGQGSTSSTSAPSGTLVEDGPAPDALETALGGPAPMGPGRPGRGGHLQAAGHLSAGRNLLRARTVARPVLWLVLGFLILAPCACFLVLAISPRLFDQGSQWFTLSFLRGVLSGGTAVSLVNSLWVSCAAAGIGLSIGFPIAWLANRTTLPGRRFVAGAMWFVLLLPSWLPALGWQRLVQPDGVMYRIGLDWPFVTHAIMGPFGVVLLLGLRCVPFTYLAITAALAGLGQEFEDAARVHGAGRLGAIRLVAPILAPAIWSALAIGFAETVSDFGVAATLAYTSHFPLATYQLYTAVNGFPPSFPAAAAMGWLLVASVTIPLALQARALRGRSYAVLSGRTRMAVRRALGRRGRVLAARRRVALLRRGARHTGLRGGELVAASRLRRHVPDHPGELPRRARQLRCVRAPRALVDLRRGHRVDHRRGRAHRRQPARPAPPRSTKVLDFLLLAAVALPSVVFAAGYIFAYNLPFLSKIGIDIYQTTALLLIGYVASSLPTNARVLVGAVSQVQASLHDAARVHGVGPARAWLRGVLPVLSEPLVMAWLLTFCGLFLELPISQLLYAPGSPPASVVDPGQPRQLPLRHRDGAGRRRRAHRRGGGRHRARRVPRLAAPAGWRRIGGGTRG